MALEKLSIIVSTVIAYGDDGISFVFGGLSDPSGEPRLRLRICATGNYLLLLTNFCALLYKGNAVYRADHRRWHPETFRY